MSSLLFLVLAAVAVAAEDPGVHVQWHGDASRLVIQPPEGEHVAPDAPFDLDLRVGERSLVVEGMGIDTAGGVLLGEVRGAALDGELVVSLCEDGGTRCRLVEVAISGRAGTRRRGTAVLDVAPRMAVEAQAGFPERVDAEQVWKDARATAKQAGKPVLLDFGAVWCPPCQRMDHELFLAERRPAAVDAFVLARLDVDDASAWPLKDRYDVGTYPTLVAVEPDGTEIGRMVGYRGVDATVGWLDATLTARAERPTGAPTPRQAADLAWRAVLEERTDDARAWLAQAEAAPDALSYRMARLHLEPRTEDVVWLAERAPERVLDWGMAVLPLEDDPEAVAAVRAAATARLADAPPLEAADLLYVVAELSAPGEAALHYAAAAALVRGQLSGDPEADKGHWDWLATLLERAGRVRDAAAVYAGAVAAFPDEPTFHLFKAMLHERHDQHDEALAAAEAGMEVAWGDNRLMVARVKAEALLGLGRTEEAVAFLREVLGGPAPSADLGVRTHRYRSRLEALLRDATE